MTLSDNHSLARSSDRPLLYWLLAEFNQEPQEILVGATIGSLAPVCPPLSSASLARETSPLHLAHAQLRTGYRQVFAT